MVHYGPHQAMSDATPIARGNTPPTIPILIIGGRAGLTPEPEGELGRVPLGAASGLLDR
jgi:hypothetical protein